MNVFAVLTGDVLIIQFENKVDALGFAHVYSCVAVPMYVRKQGEDFSYSLFTHLPSDSVCRDTIELYTGVRL